MSVFIAFRVVFGCFFLITVSIYYDSFHVVTFNYFTSITKSSFITRGLLSNGRCQFVDRRLIN